MPYYVRVRKSRSNQMPPTQSHVLYTYINQWRNIKHTLLAPPIMTLMQHRHHRHATADTDIHAIADNDATRNNNIYIYIRVLHFDGGAIL